MEIKELGHIVLFVKNLESSRHFYGDVLGWHQAARIGDQGVMFSSGRTHHELLLLEVGPSATPIPKGHRIGLYHFGLKVGETDDELREVLQTLVKNDVIIVGTADHGFTHSIYIIDPDGNEIELYIDVQPATWKDNLQAVAAYTKPLKL